MPSSRSLPYVKSRGNDNRLQTAVARTSDTTRQHLAKRFGRVDNTAAAPHTQHDGCDLLCNTSFAISRNTMVAICYATRALRFHATRWLRFVTHNVYDSLLTGWPHFDQHCVLTTRLSGGSTIAISISFVTMFDQAACRLAPGSMAGLTLCTLYHRTSVRKIMHRNCDSSVW